MTTQKQEERMSFLIQELNKATGAYDIGNSYITDKEWDDMYFELDSIEKETGVLLPNSPTQNIIFEEVSELKKRVHNHQMLSLDKTKDINAVKSFLGDKDWIAMAKMDGLTCSLRYLEGKLVSAETRGNGQVGEDILHNAKIIPSIPKTIDFKDELIIDGEIICTYNDFEAFQDIYKNPRNFASGSIRLLNSKECYNRHLTFIAWDIIAGIEKDTLGEKLTEVEKIGFTIVPLIRKKEIRDVGEPLVFNGSLNDAIEKIKESVSIHSYPIDGIVFKYDKISDYDTAGRTDHHFKGGLAFKFYDETITSYLRNIEWTMGRTGVLTPVAIYDDVEIDGSVCNRASLHNISIMQQLLGDPYEGQEIQIYKANQIIPQIYSGKWHEKDLTENFIYIPNLCPYCGEETEVRKEIDSKVLYCPNPSCNGKLINRLDHFCGKKGLDIKGLSKMTLEKLISWGWVNNISDIFKLKDYRNDWIKKLGFGVASVDKILKAIEDSRNCSMDKFICAIGIPLVGRVASTALMRKFDTYNNFRIAIDSKNEKLYQIDGIGEIMINNLLDFNYTEADKAFEFINECAAAPLANDTALEGKVFVITGKLHNYKNRDELKGLIESKGGKVTGSVTKNTNYLINNDVDSTSAKNVSAKKLNVPIISEEEFQKLIDITLVK